MPDFRCHVRKVNVGVNYAGAVWIPGDDVSVFIKPMTGAFAGGAAVECTVGFHAVELGFACDFVLT